MDVMTPATGPRPVFAPAPAPAWARRAAHAIALCAVPSGLWRIAMASGVYVGYSDQVLRDVFDIPGWGIAYVVGLSVLGELGCDRALITARRAQCPAGTPHRPGLRQRERQAPAPG